MWRLWCLVALSLSTVALAQPTERTPRAVAASALLGADFTPIPELLCKHLPALSEGGLVVEQVVPRSIADRIGLKRHDVLMRYGETPISDVRQFAGLLWATPPGNTNKLTVLREGKSLSLPCKLENAELSTIPKGMIKPVGPPAVNLQAMPLADGKLKITLTYYSGNGGKLETITCSGSLNDIETQVQQLNQRQQIPVRVQDLVEVALKRLRDINDNP